MKVLGHGIDLVEVDRIRKMLDAHGARFRDRCFTTDEQQYAEAHLRRSAEHYAARFAAKESVLKALGTGLRDGIRWTDIEVRRHPGGAPSVSLSGRASEIAREKGIARWEISLTHTATTAMASAIALAEE